MFTVLLGIALTILLLGGGIVAIVQGVRLFRDTGDKYSDTKFEGVLIGGLGSACIVLWLVLAAFQSGEITGISSGCYRIYTSTSSGVGVTVGGQGQVGVTPIVLSGRTYEPIACPQ